MAQMHWYTTLRNAINRIEGSEEWANSVVVGNKAICGKLRDIVIDRHIKTKKPCIVALDGYLGTQWGPIVEEVIGLLQEEGLDATAMDVADLYKPEEWIETLIKKYTTDDPSYGYVCGDKLIKDLLDPSRVRAARRTMLDLKKNAPEKLAAVFCHGIGSAIKPLRETYDQIFFFDLSRVSVMMKKFDNTLRTPCQKKPEEVFWKKLMYFYYHILDKHKKELLPVMDGYIDGNDGNELKLIPKEAYREITAALIKYPLKFRRFMQPGNWGGLKHKTYFELPELTNCAWDTAFYAPKQSCLVDIGMDCNLEIPFLNLQLQYPVDICGPYLAKKFPGLLPMIACIDDGYFPKPVHHERSNMPIHLHPDGEYVRGNFNEHVGRYETYYIVEAYENANTMLGFCEDAELEDFKQKVLDASEKGSKFDWTKYVKTWPSKEGDLYLIPSGTVHGTGGHQMILEMDTCPSNVGTEYSFFIYDFLRKSWDDVKKAFCANPVSLQIKHGFNQCRWYRREKWVKEHLLAKPREIRSGKGWSEEQYDTYGPMPFHIERAHFEDRIEMDTLGRFCHIVCLTKGDHVLIRSKKNPEWQTELEWIQVALVPASFGKYEFVNRGNKPCTVVRIRWKRG